MYNSDEMIAILDQVEDLPTLPTIYSKLSAMLRQQDVRVPEVTKLIETDPSISSKILKLVNSSFFGFKRKVVSLNHAIVLMGFKALRNTVLSVSVFQQLQSMSNGDFDLIGFWRHSVACGICCIVLDEQLQLGYRDEAFVAGILHDLGKVVLNRYFSDDFQKALLYAKEKKTTFYDAEKAVIGFSHDEVGEYLADRWQLPFSLVEAIALHHQPNNIRSNPQLVAVVHLSDAICHRLPFGFMDKHKKPEVDPFALNELNVSKEKLGAILEVIKNELRQNGNMFTALS